MPKSVNTTRYRTWGLFAVLAFASWGAAGCKSPDPPATSPATSPTSSPATLPAPDPARPIAVFGLVYLSDGITPADGTLITVDQTAATPPSTTRVAFTDTTQSGAFGFNKGFKPGSYIVTASPDAGADLESPLELKASATPYVVLKLKLGHGPPRGAPAASAAARRTTVFGIVKSVDWGTAFPNGRIEVASASAATQPSPTDAKPVAAMINNTGGFVLRETLAPGNYTFTATRNISIVARGPLVIPDPAPEYVVLELAAVPGGMSGRVLDENGTPVAHAKIAMHDASMTLTYWAETDQDGRYAIPHIVPAYYRVAIHSPLVPKGSETARPERGGIHYVTINASALSQDLVIQRPKKK